MRSGPKLLAHERWFSDWIYTGQEQRNLTPTALRMVQNYGPEGVRLYAAAAADIVPGAVIGITGALLRGFSPDGVVSVPVYWCLLGIGFGFVVLALMRAMQLSRAGRAHRGGRPFAR